MVPIYKEGDRLVVINCRSVSLTSVICLQMEHVISGYIRQVWDTNIWSYEDQHGIIPGYPCESQIVSVCQDISEGARIEAIIIDFSRTFDLIPYDRLLMKIAASGVDSRVAVWVRELF